MAVFFLVYRLKAASAVAHLIRLLLPYKYFFKTLSLTNLPTKFWKSSLNLKSDSD
jgi:hypothetical protein